MHINGCKKKRDQNDKISLIYSFIKAIDIDNFLE